ncbi:MAG: DUF3341 domain-containing protein [Candidatus Binatus sp.]|uniref:DUF3341 domain-containing protein n=1 Tax=Candidatus Binatus sp. TaxID=2811406 RepID=UPI00271B20ED|nr:DUF3341 domain-containing protein [Candidatus Binatus sp.]MDO8433409.1 DUF3341 domain-containing protein [Candidatus Binatus sp.]
MSTVTVIGSFTDDELCAHAIEALRDASIMDFSTFSPIPSHRIEHALGRSRSPVRWIALAGGILGVLAGLAITIGTTYEWRLNAGGRPLLSWPPFIVITFEMMILLGGIFSFFGVLFLAGLPALEANRGYRARFSADRFGLVVRCDDGQSARVESMLKEAGAEEVLCDAA